MKTRSSKIRLSALAFGLLLILSTFAFYVFETTRLVVEANHSTILFSIPISNGLTRVVGKFGKFTIDIDYVDKDITKSTVTAIIAVESINTGITARDEHLRSSDFFDVEKYPEITFNSEKIVKHKKGFIAQGEINIHGIAKHIELPFIITGNDGEDVIGFRARYKLKRSDFGVGTEFKHTSDDNFLGDDIGIEIDFWTKKPKEKKE